VLLAVAVLLALHMVADYAEGRRLAGAVARVPDAFKVDLPQPPIAEGQDAYPYYRAANILAEADIERINVVARRLEVAAAGQLDDDLRAKARSPVLDSAAWPLVERGQTRTLRRLSNVMDLVALDSLVGAKTLYSALNGDAPSAVTSSVVDLQLNDRIAGWLWVNDSAALARLQVVLTRTNPSLGDLGRLSAMLASMDRDDLLTSQVAARLRDDLDRGLRGLGGEYDIVGKVGMFGAGWVSMGVRAVRPYLAAELASRLNHYPEVLEALQRPWPQRIDAVPRALSQVERVDYTQSILRAAARLAVIRSARAAAAIERYARAHATQVPPALRALIPEYLDVVPIDPFSGEPLHYAQRGAGYAVYSVGVNRKDDGGAFTGLEVFGPIRQVGPEYRWPNDAADIGIRISR
jgi:hypothetical protein